MSFIERVRHEAVEGARFGRFNLADNSTTMIYRLGNTVIDSGPPNQWRAVKNYILERPVRQVVLTHHHEDHSGNGARISGSFQVPVYVNREGEGPIRNGFPLRLYQKIFWGRPRCFTPYPMPDVIHTGDGHRLIPIHTPGHSPDHVCFLEPDKKWLFTGDLYLATRPKLFRADEDLAGEMASLEKILAYDFQTVFCAHKGIVPDGYRLLQEKLAWFRKLVGEVRELHREGIRGSAIAEKLLGKRDTVSVVTLNHLCRENLVNACLHVGDNGKVTRRTW